MSPKAIKATFLATKEEEEKEEAGIFSGGGPTRELRASIPGGEDIVVRLESAFFEWIAPIFEDLCNLLFLPPNWDSYGAPPIEKRTVITALETLKFFPNTPRPWTVPTVHGGVRLEWHSDGIDLVIKFEPHGKGLIYYESPEGIEELEINPRAEVGLIGNYMDKFSRHA